MHTRNSNFKKTDTSILIFGISEMVDDKSSIYIFNIGDAIWLT